MKELERLKQCVHPNFLSFFWHVGSDKRRETINTRCQLAIKQKLCEVTATQPPSMQGKNASDKSMLLPSASVCPHKVGGHSLTLVGEHQLCLPQWQSLPHQSSSAWIVQLSERHLHRTKADLKNPHMLQIKSCWQVFAVLFLHKHICVGSAKHTLPLLISSSVVQALQLELNAVASPCQH